MKKFIVCIFLILLVSQSVYAKSKVEKEKRGYLGTLPDLSQSKNLPVKKKAPVDAIPSKDFNSENELKPVPDNNPAFVNIIRKADKKSKFAKDMDEIIPILESIQALIDDESNVQIFNAKVYYFNKSVEYLREKYKDAPESQFLSYKRLMELNLHSKSIALLRTEAYKYNPYMSYSTSGYIYSPNNIKDQLEILKSEIESTIIILREAN